MLHYTSRRNANITFNMRLCPCVNTVLKHHIVHSPTCRTSAREPVHINIPQLYSLTLPRGHRLMITTYCHKRPQLSTHGTLYQ